MRLHGLAKAMTVISLIGASFVLTGCSDSAEKAESESYADYIYRENLKNTCFSYFSSIVTRNYSEVPWGIQSVSENSTTANLDKLDDNNNCIITLSYKFENPPRQNSVVSIDFEVKENNIRVTGIYIDGKFYNPPEETTIFRPMDKFVQ